MKKILLHKNLGIKKIAALTCGLFLGFAYTPLWAGEVTGTIRGGADAAITSYTEKTASSTASWMDIHTGGTLGYTLKVKNGEWTTAANVELAFAGSSDEDIIQPRDANVSLENDSLLFTFGRKESTGATVGNAYMMTDVMDDVPTVGNVFIFGEYLTFEMPSTGLKLVYGINVQGNADATGDDGRYDETTTALFYGGEFGDITVGLGYTSISEKINKDRDEGVTGYAHDGGGKNGLGFGVGYKLGNISLALNSDTLTTSVGTQAAVDDTKEQLSLLIVDYEIDADSGITLAYHTKSIDDGSAAKTTETGIDASYKTAIGGASLFVVYHSGTTKDDDTLQDDQSSKLGVGLNHGF